MLTPATGYHQEGNLLPHPLHSGCLTLTVHLIRRSKSIPNTCPWHCARIEEKYVICLQHEHDLHSVLQHPSSVSSPTSPCPFPFPSSSSLLELIRKSQCSSGLHLQPLLSSPSIRISRSEELGEWRGRGCMLQSTGQAECQKGAAVQQPGQTPAWPQALRHHLAQQSPQTKHNTGNPHEARSCRFVPCSCFWFPKTIASISSISLLPLNW